LEAPSMCLAAPVIFLAASFVFLMSWCGLRLTSGKRGCSETVRWVGLEGGAREGRQRLTLTSSTHNMESLTWVLVNLLTDDSSYGQMTQHIDRW